MSIRSTAFYVPTAPSLIVNATVDSLTLTQFDTTIELGSGLIVSCTVDTKILASLDTSVRQGIAITIFTSVEEIEIVSHPIEINSPGRLTASGFFSF